MGGMRVRTVAMRDRASGRSVRAEWKTFSPERPLTAPSVPEPRRSKETIALAKNGLTGACESLAQLDHIMVLHRGADADRALLSELMRG